MGRWLSLVCLLAAVPDVFCQGNLNAFWTGLSPKLTRFLSQEPAAGAAFSNVIATSLQGQTIQLYYFYSTNEMHPRAYHSYPAPNALIICVRENQEAMDEFLCLSYEAINSTNRRSYQELIDRATYGQIARLEFVKGMMLLEHSATRSMQNFLKQSGFNTNSTVASYYLLRFWNSPETFEAAVAYQRTNSPRNLAEEYGQDFDRLKAFRQPSPSK